MAKMRMFGKACLAALFMLLIMQLFLPQRYLVPMLANIVLLGINYLALYPYVIPPKELSKPGNRSAFISQKDCDVLLVVSLKSIENSSKKNFYENDWSFAWVNTLEQEMGIYALCDVSELPENMNSRRLIILSRSVGALSEKNYYLIEDFVRKGGILILEQPTSEYSELCGFKTSGANKAGAITWIDDSVLEEPHNTYLRGMPLNTGILNVLEINPDVRTIMRIDDKPAICTRKFEVGHIISLLFNYTLQLVSIQQGVPHSTDYKLRKRFGDIRSTDLILHRKMLDNFIPFADILEKTLFHIIEEFLPLPRLWYCPFEYDGIVLMSHDEEYYGDKILFVAEHESKINATSSFFVIPDSSISAKAAKKISKTCDLELHWNRGLGKKAVKLGPIKIAGRQLPLEHQINLFKNKIGEVSACRIHAFKWDEDYTSTFQILHANNVLLDSSYGSSGGAGRGYLFGTGYPFYPIDKNGLPIPLYEVPVLIQDYYGGATAKDVAELVYASKDAYHETLVLLYHPHRIAASSELRKDWETFFDLRANHWVTNFKELLKWLQARRATNFKSSWNGEKLSIRVYSGSENVAVLIPNRKKAPAKLGQEVGKVRNIKQLNRDYILVPLPKRTVDIYYRG